MAAELRAVGAISDQILSTFGSTHDLLGAPTPTLRREIHDATLRNLLRAFEELEALDIRLRLAVDDMSEVEFAREEAALEEVVRTAVAVTDTSVALAKSLEMPESAYEAVAERARRLRMALEWTDDDYAKSAEFNRLLDRAIREHDAGETVEGGFGP